MNKSMTMALCVAASLVLTAFGVLYGAHRGWQREYAQVEAMYTKENGLEETLALRAADGANLLVVALRHLDESHSAAAALRKAVDGLNQASSLPEKAKADDKLTLAVQEVSKALAESGSFAGSARDQNYSSYLMRELDTLRQRGVYEDYNQAARDYNTRLNESASGLIARLMGVGPAAAYE